MALEGYFSVTYLQFPASWARGTPSQLKSYLRVFTFSWFLVPLLLIFNFIDLSNPPRISHLFIQIPPAVTCTDFALQFYLKKWRYQCSFIPVEGWWCPCRPNPTGPSEPTAVIWLLSRSGRVEVAAARRGVSVKVSAHGAQLSDWDETSWSNDWGGKEPTDFENKLYEAQVRLSALLGDDHPLKTHHQDAFKALCQDWRDSRELWMQETRVCVDEMFLC